MNGEASTPRPWSSWAGWTVVAMALAAADLSQHLFQGWVPHDEGALALAATLVRDGAWPHRDFTDIYSGGLALFDAGAQALLGDDLRALRIPLAMLTLAWIPLLAACFRRFVTPAAAAGLALVAYLWGPPLYPAALPSWYLLFIATAMVWCVLRWEATDEARWWGLIGLLAGLGLFLKINALFLLAGAGCALLTSGRGSRGPIGLLLIAVGTLGAFLTVLQGWPPSRAIGVLLPLVALTLAAGRATLGTRTDLVTELRALRAPLLWLGGGLLVILLPWIGAYAATGALGPLLDGVLLLPSRRALSARMFPPPSWTGDLLAAALLVAVYFARWTSRAARAAAFLLVVLTLAGIWAASHDDARSIVIGWRVVRTWGAVGLLAIAARWWTDGEAHSRAAGVVGWMAAWVALLQYPFAAPVYFAYVAPLLLLAGVAAISPAVPRLLSTTMALCLALWTLGANHGQPINTLGFRHPVLPANVPLALPRGGLEVPPWEAAEYSALVATLDRWGAARIVAGPDAPEVYYLGGRPLPDREFFEFLAPEWSAEVLARRIVAHRAQAAVLNARPGFSRVPLDSVVALLPAPPLADTVIGRFRVLRLPTPDASP